MPVILGRGGKCKVGGVDVAEIMSWDFKETAEIKNFSAMGDTHQRAAASLKSASGSIECMWDAADVGQDALTLGASVVLSLYPAGDDTGAEYYTVPCIISEIGRPVAMADEISLSFSWVSNGAWTVAAVV
jgi:hypothetical protein